MTSAGARGAAELLDAAAALPPELRARLLAELARFPLDSAIWQDLSEKVLKLTNDVEPEAASEPEPASEPRVVVQAAMLPLTPADRPARWNHIAELQPMADAIVELRNQLGTDPGAGDAAELLACLPIEDYGVAPKVFARTISVQSGRTKLWAAIAAGRVGDFAPMDAYLDELADGEVDLPFSGRWSAYRTLAQARPIPAALDAHLRLRGNPVADIVVWALTGTADVDGIPVELDGDVDLVPADGTAEAVDPTEISDQLLGPDALQALLGERLAPSTLSALNRVDPHAAGPVITNLLGLLTRRAAEGVSWRDEYPDPIMKVVAALPKGYSLPVYELLVQYVSVPGGDAFQTFARRFAFALACADPDDLLSGFARTVSWVIEHGGPESAVLIDIVSLFERVAYWTADTPGAWAGPTMALIDVGRTRAYRDIGAIIKRNERFDSVGQLGVTGIEIGDFGGYPMDYGRMVYDGHAGAGEESLDPGDSSIGYPGARGYPAGAGGYPAAGGAPDGSGNSGWRDFIRPRFRPRLRWPRIRIRPGALPPPGARWQYDKPRTSRPPPEPLEPPEPPQPPGVRKVRADVFLEGESAPRDTFVRGYAHRVAVWIGHDRDARPHTVSATSAFVDTAVARDPGPTSVLQVTFSESGRAQIASLLLPNDPELSSEPCTFDLTVAADQQMVSAMIIISQPGRTLQQLALTAATVGSTTEAATGDGITLTAEVDARPLDGATTGATFDASVHSSKAGGFSVVMQDGKACMAAPWDENIRPAVNTIAAKIYAAGRAAAVGDGDAEWVSLIRLLATKGAQLHSWLKNKPGYQNLPSAQRIQVVQADATRPLPFELVYDGARIAKTAVPCPNWDQALATGHCDHCESPRDAKAPPPFWSEAICPLGFWGLRKVIERQTGTSAAMPSRLSLFDSMMFAASDKVRQDDYNDTVKVLTNVRNRAPAIAEKWDQWPQLITDSQPTLIVALPHQGRDAESDSVYLEIGQGDQLISGQVTDMLATAPAPGPVILLLGCRTANAEASFQNFVEEFRTAGAPIVLGTIATVLGRDAAAIAQEFIGELVTASTDDAGSEIPFGEAMRTVRRSMIAQKKAAVLGLMAFGDSDWQVKVGV